MIKASGRTGDGKPLLLIGLSRGNCERLLDDQPIRFDGGLFGFPGEVVIVGGESEGAITEQIRAAGVVINQGGPN